MPTNALLKLNGERRRQGRRTDLDLAACEYGPFTVLKTRFDVVQQPYMMLVVATTTCSDVSLSVDQRSSYSAFARDTAAEKAGALF